MVYGTRAVLVVGSQEGLQDLPFIFNNDSWLQGLPRWKLESKIHKIVVLNFVPIVLLQKSGRH